jgi:uncharacterized membrane protein YgcG
MCVLILLHMYPIYVSSYYCMCMLMQALEAERLARKPQEQDGLVGANGRGGGGGGVGGGGSEGAGCVAGACRMLTCADVCWCMLKFADVC